MTEIVPIHFYRLCQRMLMSVREALYIKIYMSQLVHENEERMFQSLSDAYLDKVVILVRSHLMGEAKVVIISHKITSGTT